MPATHSSAKHVLYKYNICVFAIDLIIDRRDGFIGVEMEAGMKIGLKRDRVELAGHNPGWKAIAQDIIGRLWRGVGSIAKAAHFQKRYYEASVEMWAGSILTDIPAYPTFTAIEPLNKGWSNDMKFIADTTDGERLLLRVADIAEYDRKQTEFEILRRMEELGVPASRLADFGVCNGGKSVYQLLTWIDGECLENTLPAMTEAEQYSAGLKAGKILLQIHSIAAPNGLADWSERYFAVIDERLDAYRVEGAPFEGSEVMLAFLDNNRYLLKDRPQCRHHGDYHEGNLILSANGDISVIDWHNVDFSGYGDPWYELGRCFSDIQHYAVGIIQGYFDGEPPETFWRLFAYYASVSAITSIVWTKYRAPDELPIKLQANLDILRWFDNYNRVVPTWYLEDFYIQYIDGVPMKLKKPFDLDFIHRCGRVFKVFDSQDSGNLCFGVEAEDGKRFFVKFAGAPTERYKGKITDAVYRLKATVPIYLDLAHPSLIKFVKAAEIGGGFAVIFEWADAICAQRMYPAEYEVFRKLPLETKLRIFEDILEFHAHVAAKGYVAIDFYDGSIMWDTENERTIICDIDFYQKSPYVGQMGLWGSTRFVSPEERTDGAVIDEVTNVYTMGATAFCLFANSNRSKEAWSLSSKLYAVVKKATSDNRSERQQSIRRLQEEWRAVQ
jgi:serine/threonine-protein kinase